MNPISNSFLRLPRAVKFLLVTNTAVFLLQTLLPGKLEGLLGLVPYQVVNEFHFWQFFTYMFLHGSFLHLLFNMLGLWMFGKELEYLWGTKEFLKFYFFCGVGAASINTLADLYSLYPVIGASGAIYGLVVAFAMIYPDSLIYFYGVIPIQAKHFAILFAALEFFLSFQGSPTVVARFAHLGGMLAGFVYLKSYEANSIFHRLFHRIGDSVRVKKTKAKKQEKLKKEDLVKEVDRILEKVLIQGAASLSESEREIMRRYSSMKH